MSQWIEGVSHDTLKSSPMSFLGRIGQIPLLIRRTVICLQLCGFRCIVCIKSFFFVSPMRVSIISFRILARRSSI